MNGPGGSGTNFIPARRPGRHQVLPVCADALNEFGGIRFEAGVQGMSDGGRGKDVGRAKRQERHSFGESFPSGQGQRKIVLIKGVPSHQEVKVSVIPPPFARRGAGKQVLTCPLNVG
jgi:hypothetical protein